jgi:hypothetical protein
MEQSSTFIIVNVTVRGGVVSGGCFPSEAVRDRSL